MVKTLRSQLPGFCSFQSNTQLHGSHCQEGVKSPWPGFHHWEAGINTGWVMGRKAVSCQERRQFSAPWHLGEASRDGWEPLKVLPSCWRENIPSLSLKPSTQSDAFLLCFVTAFLSTQVKISLLRSSRAPPTWPGRPVPLPQAHPCFCVLSLSKALAGSQQVQSHAQWSPWLTAPTPGHKSNQPSS